MATVTSSVADVPGNVDVWTSVISSSDELSVRRLADLEPEVAACGHGIPMRGDELRRGLRHLANNFRAAAIPRCSAYTPVPGGASSASRVWSWFRIARSNATTSGPGSSASSRCSTVRS